MAGGAHALSPASPASSVVATGEPQAPLVFFGVPLAAWQQPRRPRPASSPASSAAAAPSRRSLLSGPTPALTAAYTVASTAILAGVSTFGPVAQACFSSAMAASLSVDPTAVAVTGVTGVARRRRLHTSGVAVAFTVSVSSASAASGVASGISAIAASSNVFASVLISSLAAAGLPICSGVALSQPVVVAPPALNLSAVDVSAAVSAVTTAFSNLTAAAAAEKQTALLSSLALGTMNTTSTPEAASAAASLVLAVVTAAPGVALSVESQSAALNVLDVVSTTANIDVGVSTTIVSALDSVVSSAASGNFAALTVVEGVINNVIEGMLSVMLSTIDLSPGAPPPAPAVITTPTIQLLVQVDPPGSTRLTTQPLTAPGSTSQFNPLGAGVLPPMETLIVTTFLSLAFDPHYTNASAMSHGMTRLQFSSPDGSPITANLTSPLEFSLPPVQLSAGMKAACMFWDAQAAAYSTEGCATVPNPSLPLPPFLTTFEPSFTASTDAQIAAAWTVYGPNAMTDNCVISVVPPGWRVISGDTCQLVQPGNQYKCSWNNTLQAFQGSGCVNSALSTQCMCRHVRSPPPAHCYPRSRLWLTTHSLCALDTRLAILRA